MKVGILSDIHGNADALAAVLSAARASAVDRLIVAGDFVGYYYGIDRVLDLLGDWSYVAVRGNHEDMLAAWLSGQRHEWIRERYGSSLSETQRRLTREQIDGLLTLPPSRTEIFANRTCFICHGSPRSTDEYVYPDADEEKVALMFDQGVDMVVSGHTHHPNIWRRGTVFAVNPGSVGQPRDYRPGACWALWDVDAHEVELRRESYDMSAVLLEAKARDPHLAYLTEVLTRRK